MKRFAVLGVSAIMLLGLGACMPGQQGAGGEGAGGSDMLMSILPLVLIFVVFYFLLIRPQQKKQKAHRAMLQQVNRGDDIVTSGGIVANVVRARDDQLLVEIAPDVRVRVMRGNVAEVIRRSEVDFDDEEDFEDDIDETDETDELEHDDGQDDEKNTDK